MDADVEFDHSDLLEQLNMKGGLSEKILAVHEASKQCCDFIDRISVALYDHKLDLVKTLAHSTDLGNPLPGYQAKLSCTKSLFEIFKSGKPRVVNDLLPCSDSEHSRRIISHGFRASYTVPMYNNAHLTGFIFFNSRKTNVFDPASLANLDMIARLLSLLVSMELNQVSTMHGALKTATSFSSYRDPETGAHLERMARFSRLIANEVAVDAGLQDEFAESILWAAPMHDIGKIAIPDHILLKPGKLTHTEFELMKTHTLRGKEIIATMLNNFSLEHASLAPVMRNIAEYHHENMDGSGYPHGLKGDAIPIEARIIAVADVFDALTSKRSYKSAWSNEEAFNELHALSTWKLDKQCVDILTDHLKSIEDIQSQFMDEHCGWHTQDAPLITGDAPVPVRSAA